MIEIDKAIKDIDKVIYDNIELLNSSDRWLLSQNILWQIRNLLEHVFLKFYIIDNNIKLEPTYPNLQKGINYVFWEWKFRDFKKFHELLQISASHYTLDKENSERLMLRYLVYLHRLKKYLKTKYSLNILENLDKFPTDINSSNKEYYEKIIKEINSDKLKTFDLYLSNERYYIQKIKPLLLSWEIFYEVTFTRADDKVSKFDRIIAFTKINILSTYSSKFKIRKWNIELLWKKLPINIIESWEVSIRPCEFDNFIKILWEDEKVWWNKEVFKLMEFLTKYNLTLVDLINLEKVKYKKIKLDLTEWIKVSRFFDSLDKAYEIVKNNKPWANILKYLLFNLNNRIIKAQYNITINGNLSNLKLKNWSIPFDKMPFCSWLLGHNPKMINLFDCLNTSNRKHEFLARHINNNIEQKWELFTQISSLDIEDLDWSITKYNSIVYSPLHSNRLLKKLHNNIYFKWYTEDTINIIERLQRLSTSWLDNYSKSARSWLEKKEDNFYDDAKKDLLIKMFEKSRISFIYWAAWTWKTTMINLISDFLGKKWDILFLANTHPAVDNLKRRVDEANDTNCITIKKFISKRYVKTEYDLLVIDESSTVSNEDMLKVLKKTSYKLLVLVGDIYQIEAIKFWNWFDISRRFIPKESIFELINIHRTKNEKLLDLWSRVRNLENSMVEHISKNGYSVTLDESIFNSFEKKEIILCLNYDWLYWVNNINRFLQLNNPSEMIEWWVHVYKEWDPILFNELANERFDSILYNNLKWTILNIKKGKDVIEFEIEVDTFIDESDLFFTSELKLLEEVNEWKSVISFMVKRYWNNDYENEDPATIVPFQIAYAVSIHKAQGLEYDSVKIVIADEVWELITHNIFYTAITRAREKLKIYWTPETQNQILSSFEKKNNNRDFYLLTQLMNN